MTLTALVAPADIAGPMQLHAQFGLHDGSLGAALFGLIDHLNAGFAIKEVATGRYVHANAVMASFCGRTPDQMLGCSDIDIFGFDSVANLRSAEQTAVGQTIAHTSSHKIERDRTRRDFDVTRVVLPSVHGGPPRYLCSIWVETTQHRLREMQLGRALQQLEQHQVAAEALRREVQDPTSRDRATGLYQRGNFDDQLRREVDLSSREHREFALVSIALDAPPATAEPMAETARARVLESLGRLLRSNTRAMDASCRIDDDHFAVLLSGVGLATAHSRMEGLRRQCATQIVVLDGREMGFTVSMGVASFPHTAHSQDSLLGAADGALKEAQRRGGNHVALASIRFES